MCTEGLLGRKGTEPVVNKKRDVLPPSCCSLGCWTLRRAGCSTRQERRQPQRAVPQTVGAPSTSTPALPALPVEPQAGRAQLPRLHLSAPPLVQRRKSDLPHWHATPATVLKGMRGVLLAAAELSVRWDASRLMPRRRGCRAMPFGSRQVDRRGDANHEVRRASNEGVRGTTKGGLGGRMADGASGGGEHSDTVYRVMQPDQGHGKQNRVITEEPTHPRICTVTQTRTAERGENKQGSRTKQARDNTQDNPPNTAGTGRSRKSRQHDLPHRL